MNRLWLVFRNWKGEITYLGDVFAISSFEACESVKMNLRTHGTGMYAFPADQSSMTTLESQAYQNAKGN